MAKPRPLRAATRSTLTLTRRFIAVATLATQLCLQLSAASTGFLDVDDLKNSQFDISILAKPVLLNSFYDETAGGRRGDSDGDGSREPENSLVLSSKYGQLYQCSLPVESTDDEAKTKTEDASPANVIKLLSPMKDGPCLFYTKGWWSYEFCYGREVKQYHFENGAIQGETISLGKFESDYDWSKTEAWEASAASAKEASAWEASTKAKAKKRKHHSQYYVDGSKCDLTGEPRKTEVRFKCDESLKGSDTDVISEIEEPSSCTYLFTVSTIRICSHPRFREEKVKKAAAISCSPALSQPEFEKYTKLQERTAKRVKEMGERLRNLNAKYEEKLERRERREEALEKGENLLTGESQRKDKDLAAGVPSKMTPTLEKFFKEVYSPKKLKKNVESDVDSASASSFASAPDVASEDANQESDEDLAEFRDEAKSLTPSDAATAKQSIASVLKGQFDEIYEEAKEELSKETGQDFKDDTDTEKAALETLTRTLNKLLDQLDKTEKQLDTTGKDLKESIDGKQEKWWQKHNEAAQMDNNVKESEMKQMEEDKLAKWIEKTIQKDKLSEDAADDKSSEDNLVKVRISKLSKSNVKGMKPISIDKKDEKKLSKAVQEELEKAGLLDTQGRQVEVRIVTSGFFQDEDEDGVHTLSQGDSSQFRTLLSSLLGANSQQINEEYRKSQMKSNYRFVWTGDKLEEDEEKKELESESKGN